MICFNIAICLVVVLGANAVSHSEMSALVKYIEQLDSTESDEFPTIDEYLADSRESSLPEYKQFYGSVIEPNSLESSELDSSELDSEELVERDVYSGLARIRLPPASSKHKRFLQSVLDFLSKDKKKTTTTTRKPQQVHSTPKAVLTTFKPQLTSASSVDSDDPFHRMKIHCHATYDDFCRAKKKEIFDLVIRCEKLSADKKVKAPDACKDVYSIYCYIYKERDPLNCVSGYVPYKPGQSKLTNAPTASTRIIPVITQGPYRPTPAPITTRSTTTTTTTKSSTTTTTKKGSAKAGPLESPFNGPVNSVPNDADKLKQIGNYCVKVKGKEPNCDKSLSMLKDKFKSCEKMPKSDTECQSFKMNFCAAFTQFPCCPDVLAGRTCSGKSNSKRNYM